MCSEHLIMNKNPRTLHEGVHWYASVLSLVNIIRRLCQTSPNEPNTSNFPLYSSSHLFIKFTSSFPRLFLSCTHTHTLTHSLLTYFLRALQMATPPQPHFSTLGRPIRVREVYIYIHIHYKAVGSLYSILVPLSVSHFLSPRTASDRRRTATVNEDNTLTRHPRMSTFSAVIGTCRGEGGKCFPR